MPPDEAKQAIKRVPLDDIMEILRKQKGWPKTRADEAEQWYRNFLWLSYLFGDEPVYAIYKDSDDVWHAHMVYTERYRKFVVPVFGRFLNHTPITGQINYTYVQRFQRSLDGYQAEFAKSPLGVPLSDFVSQCY